MLVATQVMNLAFVPWLGHAGLALSIGLAALVNAGWLLFGLRRRGLYSPLPGWGAFAGKVVVASAVLGGLLWWAARAIDWIHTGGFARAGLVAAVLGGVALVYFAMLTASGLRLRQFMRRG
jgi:putative peptidoglycan lipid II flippase